ncbi:protein kinase superfamily [Castilleja foliolosa]|uniref:Protein kinase superfamily n=1 Tax=Castilleja foliolosa TaxID=1961234 RepID=A0ABD3CRM1_9LAMI
MGVEVVWFIFIMFSLPSVYADYQGDALYAFKQKITRDPKGFTSDWNPSLVDPCTWPHVHCYPDGQVIRIDLGGAGISGQLVPQLGRLKYLQYLELYNNKLTGQIPEEIGYLSNLISLDLYKNSLSGPIPDTLGNLNKLKYLDSRIQSNKLTGPIPLTMASLKHLSIVSVGFNPGLCGPFTARCIDSKDRKKCTNNYSCPCRCGPTFSKPCDYKNVPLCNATVCC